MKYGETVGKNMIIQKPTATDPFFRVCSNDRMLPRIPVRVHVFLEFKTRGFLRVGFDKQLRQCFDDRMSCLQHIGKELSDILESK